MSDEIRGMEKMGTTVAKLMTQIEREFEDDEDVRVKHVMVICEMDYREDGDRQSHVILETDEDSRILQIGMATAAQNAALYGEAVGED